MSLKDDKRRITAIIRKEIEQDIQRLAEKERRTKSSMTAILLEEAIENRRQIKEGELND